MIRNIEECLKEPNAMEALREFALQLYARGFTKDEIYRSFLDYTLQEGVEETYKDIVEDVMDMLTGWYVGKNIDPPK